VVAACAMCHNFAANYARLFTAVSWPVAVLWFFGMLALVALFVGAGADDWTDDDPFDEERDGE